MPTGSHFALIGRVTEEGFEVLASAPIAGDVTGALKDPNTILITQLKHPTRSKPYASLEVKLASYNRSQK